MKIKKIKDITPVPGKLIDVTGTPSDTNTYNANAINKKLGTNDLEDITSQCEFKNCKYVGGKIFVDRKNKILYFQVAFTATVTSDWTTVIILPDDITPIPASGNGTAICATPFWIYTSHDVLGGITSGETKCLASMCLLQ